MMWSAYALKADANKTIIEQSIIIEDEKGRGLYISPGANFCFQRAVYVESRTMKEFIKLKQMAQDIISQATFPITNGS